MTLPLPEFYSPEQVGEIYLERAAQVAQAADGYRRRHAITPARADTYRIAALGIDPQLGFCHPGASLYVPGAVEDTQRTLGWLYRNLDKLSGLYFSLDTHHVFQIFHPAWWTNADGEHPPPFTSITRQDVESGRWRPKDPSAAEYTRQLERAGRYVLTIWPYHTLLGGVSHALVPALMEAAIFYALVRQTAPHFELKGSHPLTENYSVLSPEVSSLGGQAVGGFNQTLVESLTRFDRIYVFGQAKSHCVLSTLRDLADHLKDRALLQKIWILQDAMSPVPAPPLEPLPDALNFPRLAEQGLAELAERGMRLVKTTDPI